MNVTQLFVEGRMSYLRYFCLFTHSGVQQILCCVFVCFSSSCVPYVASFSRFFILMASSVFFIIYLAATTL